jgi:hypothetical protein
MTTVPFDTRAMTRDAGWAAVLSADDEPMGRGHVFVQAQPAAAPGSPSLLRGEVESLRLAGAGPSLPSGVYRLRFERSEETREVWVERCEVHLSGRCLATIRFMDPELPVTAEEVSEGE